MQIIKLISYLSISLMLLSPLLVYAERPFYNIGLNFSHEDNIGHAALETDIFSDNIMSYFSSVNYLYQLNHNSGLLFKGAVQWSDYNQYTKLDNLILDVGVTYRYKPDLHFTAPWYSLNFKISESIYDTSELRDNYAFSSEAVVGKRITDRIMVKMGLAYKDQSARTNKQGLLGNKLYDIDYTKVFLTADYFYKRFIFYSQYTFQKGDVVSNAETPTRKIILASKAIQKDDALGSDNNSDDNSDNNYGSYGYRLDAKTHRLDFGINYALDRVSALDFTIQLIDVRGDGNNNYKNYTANFGYFYRFK
ncbi:MAG: hypothetical protein KZQ83_09130 [gamma proteobacterium symbiont of Taylorina sp.]|nr:hypothetical protein [gamma proteobacterium symbiont of Taylorina sp.]